MAPKLKVAAGPTSVDAVALSSWLLSFGLASIELREEMAHWTEWLANTSPPWTAYRATMASHLVAMNKMPGVRPLGIGEIYRRLWAMLVIKDCGSQEKQLCGTSQLCAGLEAEIEGAIHSVHKKINITNALSFPEPNEDTSTTTIVNIDICLQQHIPAKIMAQ